MGVFTDQVLHPAKSSAYIYSCTLLRVYHYTSRTQKTQILKQEAGAQSTAQEISGNTSIIDLELGGVQSGMRSAMSMFT